MASTPGGLSAANDAAVLAVGLNPSWVRQTYTALADGADMPRPSATTDGIETLNVVQALLSIGVRANPAYRTATLTIDTLDAGEDYVATVAGTAVTYDSTGDTSIEEVATGLGAAIAADGTVGPLVNVAVDGAVITLTGKVVADYSIAVSATGSAALSCEADAASCAFSLYALMRGASPVPTGWRLVADAADVDVDAEGYVQRLEVGSLQSLYCRLTGIAGVTGDGAEVRYAPLIHFARCRAQ